MSKILLPSAKKLIFPKQEAQLVMVDGLWRAKPLPGVPLSAFLARRIRVSGWLDTFEQEILDLYFRADATTWAGSHIGLFTTTPNDAGAGGVEVSGGSYAREAFARNTTNWALASGTAPAANSNAIAITFTTATAAWGTVASWGYFDAASAGNLEFFAVLDTAKSVDNGDTASMAIGAIGGQVGDPGDTY